MSRREPPRQSLLHSATLQLTLLAAGCLAAATFADEPASATTNRTPNDFDLAGWLDGRFQLLWVENGVEPDICDDATYCRRVWLDLVGRIPSVIETREFLEDASPDKRARLVDKLLSDPDATNRLSELHAEHMARIWRRTMLPPGTTGAAMGAAVEPWLEQQFRDNKPYDQFVTQLLTARGEDSRAEAVYYQALGGTPESEATEISRVFLGVRIGCAQCHDHPFTDWKQADFWGMAAFFSGTTAQGGAQLVVDGETVPVGISDDAAQGTIEHEGKTYTAKALWQTEPVSLTGDQKPRDVLAEWLTSDQNPTFAANAVNRVWQQLLGRGLVSSVDDLDLATPEERELVLDDLAKRFASAGYDMRWLISGICKSRAYQCEAHIQEGQRITLLEGRRPLKTMTPEQTFDSLEQALNLPVSRSSDESARHNGEMSQIVQRLDESLSASPEDYTAGVPQTLLLMNGSLLAKATDLDQSRTLRAVVESPFLSDDFKLDTLYLAAFTRLPNDEERTMLRTHLDQYDSSDERKSAYGDIFWALLNSPEFVLCR